MARGSASVNEPCGDISPIENRSSCLNAKVVRDQFHLIALRIVDIRHRTLPLGRLVIREQTGLLCCELDGARALFIVVCNVVDPVAHGISPHLADIAGLQDIVDLIHVPHSGIEPKIVVVAPDDHRHPVMDD